MGWLRDTFPEPDDDSTEVELIRYARAYILQIIRGYLMPDLSRNLIHLRWLLKLVDFRAASKLSWGSTVLATLYREMCGATVPNKAKIGSCLSLLQSWARYRLLFLRPRMNHPHTFPLITRWNHSASYVGIPTSLEDIRLLLDQRSEAQFEWTPYEDPTVRAVIPDELFQNPNIWHVKAPMVTYAIVEMHQSDRVLRQFGFRQSIPVTPEKLDDEHEIDLRQPNTDWPRYWSNYIEMWENRYDYIPTQEPIIVAELACVPEYMSWFRIHGKPYLLSEEERRRQIRVERERRGPLNPRIRDDDASPSIAATQPPGPSTAPPQSPSPIVQQTTPISQPFQMMPVPWQVGMHGSSPFPITPAQPSIYRPPSHEGSHESPSESSSFYQSPSPYGILPPSPWMMQTPPGSLFYQCGSSSQHPQPDPILEEPESPPEEAQHPADVERRSNLARNRRRPPCGTDSDRHQH
ncbi:hypothetical protein J1N35_006102 [Gossypium stocksii]|uniref:Aminotransferase-like plant mobile domain-containing protein n=1 Tax=Gossypium stocksii TaxID=47602 RepID=A0A9D4AHR6_9ROSI|nr:hypothetical protein J1N35_006102 [Gossypium stocksii]